MCAIKALENNVVKERASFRAQIQKLKVENASLTLRLRQMTEGAKRKPGDGSSPAARRPSTSPAPRSTQSRRSQGRKVRSRSSSASGRLKTSSLSSASSLESLRSRKDFSRPRVTRSYHFGAKGRSSLPIFTYLLHREIYSKFFSYFRTRFY